LLFVQVAFEQGGYRTLDDIDPPQHLVTLA
jgi:hypothetical protein